MYGDSIYCNVSSGNLTRPQSYPLIMVSGAQVDDQINQISLIEGNNFTILINGTDLNADKLYLIFLKTPIHCNLSIHQQQVHIGDSFPNMDYTLTTISTQWPLTINLFNDLAGTPLDTFSYLLSDGVGNSSTITISINVSCDIGRYYDKSQNICVSCPAGYFSNTTGSQSCLACPLGTFQPLEHSSKCSICPNKYTTYDEGSTFCVYYYENCVMLSDIKFNDFGISFNIGVLCFATVILTIFLFLLRRDSGQNSTSMLMSQTQSPDGINRSATLGANLKKKKMSVDDLMEIVKFNFIFLQLLYFSISYNPEIDPITIFKVAKGATSVTNVNVNLSSVLSFASITNEQIMQVQQALYVITMIFIFVCTLNMAIVLNENLLKKYLNEKIMKGFNSSIGIFYSISQAFFIPMITAMFRIFSCTMETNEVPVFLDYFCSFSCWSPSHIVSMILITILFCFFFYLSLKSLAFIKKMKKVSKKVHFFQDNLFQMSFIVLNSMMAGMSVLLTFNQDIMIYFILFLEVDIFVVACYVQPYGDIERLNIMVRGEIFVLVVTSIASIVGLRSPDLNLNYIVLPFWGASILVILIILLMAPELMKDYHNKRLSMMRSSMMTMGEGKTPLVSTARNEETERKQTLIEDNNKEDTKKSIFIKTETGKNDKVEEKEELPKKVTQKTEEKNPENVAISSSKQEIFLKEFCHGIQFY